jgi:hypothetical protein
MRPSTPTWKRARRWSMRLEPADWRPADKDAVGAGHVLGHADREEPTVEREFARPEVEPVEFGSRGREQPGLVRGADLARDGDDQAARPPRGVFSHTSASWMTYPNSVGERSLPLRIGRASGPLFETKRSVIRSPASR